LRTAPSAKRRFRVLKAPNAAAGPAGRNGAPLSARSIKIRPVPRHAEWGGRNAEPAMGGGAPFYQSFVCLTASFARFFRANDPINQPGFLGGASRPAGKPNRRPPSRFAYAEHEQRPSVSPPARLYEEMLRRNAPKSNRSARALASPSGARCKAFPARSFLGAAALPRGVRSAWLFVLAEITVSRALRSWWRANPRSRRGSINPSFFCPILVFIPVIFAGALKFRECPPTERDPRTAIARVLVIEGQVAKHRETRPVEVARAFRPRFLAPGAQ